MKDVAVATFETFSGQALCEAVFPANIVKDDFSLVRFAPLRTPPDTTSGAWTSARVVLPRDIVNPELINRLAADNPELPLKVLKGGVFPFNAKWNNEIQPPPAAMPPPGPIFNLPSTHSDSEAAQPQAGPSMAPDTRDEAVASSEVRTTVAPKVVEGVAEAAIAQTVLPRFEFVLHLPYRQTWELLGYSRGEMLNTISLAPQEETTIEVFTWDRTKIQREEALSLEQETALDSTFSDKDSMEVLKEVSKLSDWKVNVGGNITIPVEAVSVGVQAGFDQKEALNTLNRATHQTVSEAVLKGSSRVRTTRQTKVAESREFGREERLTRKIRNPNVCRTLNLDYFEVLANYKVTTQLDLSRVAVCVLAPNPIREEVDRRFLLTYEGALREALLSPVTYADGFEACHKLAAWERICSVKLASPCAPNGSDVPPATAPGAPDPLPAAKAAIASAARAVRESVARLQAAGPNQIIALANDVARSFSMLFADKNSVEYKQWDEEWTDSKTPYHQWLYRKIAMELFAPRFWDAARRYSELPGPDESPESAEQLVMSADSQLIDLFNVATLGIRGAGKVVEVIGELAQQGLFNTVPLVQNAAFDDAGFDSAFRQLRNSVEHYRLVTAVQAPSPTQPSPTGPGPVKPPDFEPREIAEAQVSEEALLAHVRANESYYRQAIWQRMDPDDRYVLLSLYGDLLTYVSNQVVGFVGKQAALPYRISNDASMKAWFKTNVLDNEALKAPQDVGTVTVPTRGVTMETRLGQCDACEEFIVRHRDLDLRHKAADVVAAEQRAEQEKAETDRYLKRLANKPPLLDDPDPHQNQPFIRVRLDRENPAQP